MCGLHRHAFNSLETISGYRNSSVLDQDGQCTADLYLAWPCVKSCDVESCAQCPSRCKLGQLAAFQGMDVNGAHQEDSYSHTWKQVLLINMPRHFSFTSLIVSFSCEVLLRYLVYRVLTIIIFSRLINHNKQKKIFCMHLLHFLSYILDSCKQVHRTFNQG